ncbi:uncharacterized protein LOC111023951 [Momordica charantia]|uniref:Uncharacterized protein LOC111023951 n=1 Tax=Momordica charantia TaxID=3673 RepID=A0A6J1DTV6_MOMCH|nr:uncharacterized protein LOC111023951 [Momordica charantia]
MKLRVLKRDFEELKLLAEKQEPILRFYESRAQNITMGYLIWERFFFFALSQTSSPLKCIDWRVVLGLSLVCSFVYFLLFLEAVTMLYRTQNQMDMICKEQSDICQQILDAGNQDDGGSAMEAGDLSDGVAFNFSFHMRTTLNYDYSFRIFQKKVYISAIISSLVAVTALELYA